MYSGFLIKIGNYVIPTNLIRADSYKAYVVMQDVDDWTDANGYLHREAVDLKAEKVEFETKNMLTDKELSALLKNIQANYTIPKARQFMFTAYIPEYDEYVTQTGYLADLQPQMFYAGEDKIKYNPVRLAVIGGVYDG